MSGSNFGLAPPVVVNPLAAQTTALDAAGKVYQLRQQQSKEAAGQAFQNSLNPDGTPNQSAFLSNLKANPTAAMSALETAQQGQTLDHNTYVTHNARINSGMAGMAQLISEHPEGIPADAAHAFIERQVSLGHWTPEIARSLHAQVSDNPRANTQLAIQGLTRGMEAKTALDAVRPPQINENVGGAIQPLQPPSRTGSAPPQAKLTPGGPGVPLGLTPEQEAEIVEITDNRKTLPDGSANPNYNQKTQITRGDALRAAGIDPRNPGGANPNVGTGRPPPALVSPNGPQPGAPAAPAPRPISSPPTKSDQDLADKSGPRFQADIDQGNEQNTTQATLSNMQSDINRFTTGSGAQRTLDWKRAAEYWAPGLARMAGVKSDAVAAQESFQKAVAMIVSQQSRGTDKGQELQMHATPNDYLSPEGADTIIRQLQGNADYLQARAKLAQAWPNRTDYGGFQTSVKDLDPRYFQYNHLTPEQKTAYFSGLPEKEREAFKSSYTKTQAMVSGR